MTGDLLESDVLMREARGWLADVYGEELTKDLTDEAVETAIQYHYDGGLRGFAVDFIGIERR